VNAHSSKCQHCKAQSIVADWVFYFVWRMKWPELIAQKKTLDLKRSELDS
jgi:hypothetical protein